MAKYILGIDSGLTNFKSVLFDLKGQEIATVSTSTQAYSPKPSWVEIDADSMWDKIAESIRETVKKADINPKDICASGATAYGNGVFLIDKDGNPTRPALGSNDNRAVDIEIRISKSKEAEEIRKINNSSVFAFQPMTMARWVKEEEPDVYNKTAWFCQCKDYIVFKLTGERSAERNDVSGAAYLDMNTREYSKDLFELMGVPEMYDRVAPLAEFSRSIVGKVTHDAAVLTGLAEGTPVCAGMMDVAASCIGTGVVTEKYACSIVGTWSINEVVTDKIFPNMTSTQCFDMDNKILSLMGGGTSASNLEWYMEQFGEILDIVAKEKGISRYDEATLRAATIPPGGTSVLYLPYIGTPNPHPRGRASFSNIAMGHTHNDLIHALFEGITFEHLRNINVLRDSGAPFDTVRLAGGGAKSDYWGQMFSDIYDLTVETVAADELAALGVAIAAAVGAGVFPDYNAAFKDAVKIKKTYTPIKENVEAYAEQYKSWMAMVEGMMPIWDSGKIRM